MSARASQFTAKVLDKTVVSPHLIRLRLGEAPEFVSTGCPDEWVGLVVPGQYQSRYYTVREVLDQGLVIDVVVHEAGLVTEWAVGDCLGAVVTLTEPKGSFSPPAEAKWLLLVGDLTAMPAMSRIAREITLPTYVWAEVPDALPGYLPESAQTTWLSSPAHGSTLAEAVLGIAWPDGPGYFWMAGESAQMRAIRKHLMRDRRLSSHEYDVMGYWRASPGRQPRAVDRPAPHPAEVYAAGKAAGQSDAEIWEAYDALIEETKQ